jgi:hypothetical protein
MLSSTILSRNRYLAGVIDTLWASITISSYWTKVLDRVHTAQGAGWPLTGWPLL